jgi:hypothetical protein
VRGPSREGERPPAPDHARSTDVTAPTGRCGQMSLC